ncbi:NADH dehydrogenase [ubiquinone] 1 alpha subcomplex assembly factor 4 isoform X4 [Hypanus sabinus]|uniref:NADH dehydrogenase [ubiquinone] 1 alpha subcomplex assembly factor 4 isoform X4 n=1 Tax=Hypanus sabinus TaxID=79690 RepID=UPI0028C49292|nr:NADH dehydrogenase [ubiquinone] 1 alpha subcomplex assembly factor 4 isoform X4 [Hypanus sabinus]XP_059837364.1 NADH dehydrogenase [ubiquinone] 1 alpha subcomplex assembly factor 4 isoform X4 [Hypanus sabinus]XP_059837365.1 NADH dehydrogenase [ubiquinone] 1 alpha subcomplex assembly factor 4 isoform X4 [Hypanus sabinus]
MLIQKIIHRSDGLVLSYAIQGEMPSSSFSLPASTAFALMNVPINETSKQLQEYRFPKVTLNHDPAGITQVPKGKLSIVEVLAVINNHKLHPEVWTAEKIAEDYSLELKDVKGLLEYFKPFEMKILPPKQKNKELISTR